ncbi:hypothetical protein E1B28_000735 [Marasmius oreades]|uniref:IPT/TIG domain-containing protein n=1 Tax=Marasmius oreades TaxID=181124 RepID=A0A9P8AEF9_9AGAR|nr:uncharacterized protein E1B28_000735 [Marasmius oreades]KAG7098831.1 hypothetical protein E1B28_000735 [Marasmius oreades]
MLDIDDIIQSDAYDDEQNHKSANYCPPMSLGIKPVPPPPPLQRKYDPVSMKVHKVVYPPKESCFSLPIIFPNLSGGNLKSRVETQIRVTIDLAHPTSSPDPTSYDRVGSWKYLKLPQGTATKRRSRKQGRIDPDPQDILYLTFSVNCASEPCSRVVSCSSCQAREAKRVAKKIAARVRPPAPSDSEADDAQPISNSNDPSKTSPKFKHEDPSSIIQFNCSPLIDFSNGTTVLPLRITCYCRHHREKVGFHVNLTLVDYMGRVVGAGTTKPIMITDDHKSGNPAKLLHQTQEQTVYSTQVGWKAPTPPAATAPSKRRTAKDTNNLAKASSKKKRATPYDTSLKSNRVSSRETSLSLSSAPSPDPTASSPIYDHDVSHTQDHEMSSPPEHSPATLFGQISAATPPSSSETPSLNYSYGCTSHSQDSQSESSPDGLITPTDLGPAPTLSLDVAMLNEQMSDTDLFSSSPQGVTNSTNHLLPFLSLFSSLPHNPNATALPSPPPPVIHRLIPSCGPTHGGIEVTVLGANFHMALVNELTCVFGGVEATSTTRWSDNALVCVLPPRAQPGVVEVEVRVGGEEKREDAQGQQPTLFTYSDESDRALMELALQVVGLKMTGKIEDAKNVAMRIVGADISNNSSSLNTAHDNTLNGGVASTLLTATSDFESLVIKFLSLLDIAVEPSANPKVSTHQALRHSTQAGQTLLHFAAFVGYPKLLQFLSDRWEGDGEIDKRDKNGMSALHFTFLRLGGSPQDRERRIECAKILLNAGADREVVDALGRTAEEIGGEAVADILRKVLEGVVAQRDTIEDAEAEHSHLSPVVEDGDEWWGDAEDDDVEYAEIGSVRDRVRKRRQLRRACKEKDQATVDSAPSLPTNEKVTETDVHGQKAHEKEKIRDLGPDEKQALSFLDMLSRTMAHLPGAHALPYLPVNLPNLPLPPLAFPVMLQALFGGATNTEQAEDPDDTDKPAVTMGEWKALWEKWLLTWQQGEAEEEAPPEYTPRAEPEESHQPQQLERRCPTPENSVEEPSGSIPRFENLQELGPQTSRSAASKRVTTDSYQNSHVTEQDLSAYRYQPKMKAKKGFKGDKMLVLFWIPILLISLIWACHTGLQFAIRAVKSPVGWSFNKIVAEH